MPSEHGGHCRGSHQLSRFIAQPTSLAPILCPSRCCDVLCVARVTGFAWQHSAELEPQALKFPVGVGLCRAMIGIIKTMGEEGANIDLMQ